MSPKVETTWSDVIKLGMIMTDEAANEGSPYSESLHMLMAMCWAEGFEHAKGHFHAERLAGYELKRMIETHPYTKKIIDRLCTRERKAPQKSRALFGPEPLL